MRLSHNKAHGPDELSPQLLKLLADKHAPALTIRFQQSYLSSTPKEWNSAIAAHKFKGGLNSDPSSQWPISKLMNNMALETKCP